ncbi:MAG: phytanoyl-CoA dioxygenase family protein [Sulfitobacter sp.]|nr:phytanoyl-CoA dioxygenase family protein [Sulfitobacter sp.]
MLSDTQRDQFVSDGYVLIRAVVPEELLASIDSEVESVVASDPPSPGTTGKHFYFLPSERLPAADLALRKSGALSLAEELTSPHQLVHGYGHIQIALNIPSWEHTPGGPHLDGYHDPERPHPFTLLAAIFLGNETRSAAGNLWVWPGSHLAHARLFQADGVKALMETGGHSTLLQPPLDLGEPVPVLANRGDLLLAHYLLGHNSGGNTTTRTRRVMYYRLSTTGHDDRWDATLTDPFMEYPTIRP